MFITPDTAAARRDDMLAAAERDRLVSQARPKRHGMRLLAVIAVIAIAAILSAILAACGGTAAAAPTTPPPAAPAAPAPVSPHTQIANWVNGGGMTLLTALEGDLGQVTTDANNQDMPALATDGSKLESDANAALADPPPIPSVAAPYRAAMGDFATAGSQLAAGDIAGATTSLGEGATQIGLADSAIHQLGG